jgi:hypothetical protein
MFLGNSYLRSIGPDAVMPENSRAKAFVEGENPLSP